MKYGPAACAIDVSSYKKYPLTCAQALPGRGVTTLALAAQTMTALAVGSCSW
jgi:DNA-binding MurR/RpiR family transcriptional regulator